MPTFQVLKLGLLITKSISDDVIIMLTNTVSSLAAVQSVLQKFNNVSPYKVNENKSYVLGLGLDAITSNILHNLYTYPWADKGIAYLRITLTKSKGYPVITTLKPNECLSVKPPKSPNMNFHGLAGWQPSKCSYSLHYYIYVLPIPLSNSYLKSIQSIVHSYVWQGKKTRHRHSKIIKHRLAGGMGYTDLKDYYLATILSQMTNWTSKQSNTLWGNIKNHLTPCNSFKN